MISFGNRAPRRWRRVSVDTKSLVDMLWDREWASGEWTTPERRAQLEVQITELDQPITDPMIKATTARTSAIGSIKPGDVARGRTLQQRQSPKSQGSYYAAAAPASGGGNRPWTPQGGWRRWRGFVRRAKVADRAVANVAASATTPTSVFGQFADRCRPRA